MFPFNYGFHWNPGTIIFLGSFFAVVIIIGVTLIASILRARRTMRTRSIEAIRWETDFHDLPISARVCRHELSGELKQRTCDNGFDCRTCPMHAQCLSQQTANSEIMDIEAPNIPYGFSLPADRLYHRGHTWVKQEEDGTYTVGLDDFAKRLMGSPDSIELPSVGTKLELNSKAWNMNKGTSSLRILSPLDGKVIATNDGSEGWFLKIKPATAEVNTNYLLNAHEAASWIRREFEHLQHFLADPKLGLTLADGGTPIQDFAAAYPKKNWDKIYCDMFLEA
jgi:glycine cleavage system H lipoate-binding protein